MSKTWPMQGREREVESSCDSSFAVGDCGGRRGLLLRGALSGRKRVVFGEPANALGDAVSGEVVALDLVVLGVVGRNPVRDRIDIKSNLL